MNTRFVLSVSLALIVWPFFSSPDLRAAEPPVPRFTAVTLDDHIQIGYGLAIADVDGDGHPDIIAAGRRTHNVKIYFNDIARPAP